MCTIRTIHVELAARCPVDAHPVESSDHGVLYKVYRFDARHICGDFIEVKIVAAFAGEQTARQTLCKLISRIE